MDYLKQLSSNLGGKVQKQNHSNANIGHSSRKIIVKSYKKHRLIVDEYEDQIDLIVQLECDFSFSINKRDILFGYDRPVIDKSFPYAIFISKFSRNLFDSPKLNQFWDLNKHKIASLELSINEAIFIYKNQTHFILNLDREFLSDIDKIIEIVADKTFFGNKVEIKIDKKNIPDNLRALIPLLKKWAVSDDSEREELIDEATEKQKKKLIRSVNPHMSSINEFLDSFGNEPLSEEAILIGNLTELVSELMVNRHSPTKLL